MRIIAIKTHAAGDLLLVTPALRALRRAGPDIELILITGRANEEVARGIPGLAAALYVDERGLLRNKLGAAYTLYKNIGGMRADKAVVFQPSPRLARLVALTGTPVYAPTAAKTPGFLSGSARWQPNVEKYIAENYVEVAEAAGGVRDDLRLDYVIPPGTRDAAALTGFASGQRYVAVAPAGGRNPRECVEAKLPPVTFFAEMIDFINDQAARPVVLVGGPGDEGRCAAVAARCRRPPVDLAGKTTVGETAQVIRGAAYIVTVDSLPMHLAVALRKPGLAVFGPTNPKALLPRDGAVVAFGPEVECAPCYANSLFPPCRRPFKYECRERVPLGPIKQFVLDMEKE